MSFICLGFLNDMLDRFKNTQRVEPDDRIHDGLCRKISLYLQEP